MAIKEYGALLMKNPVAKHAWKYNKATVHLDRKKQSKRNSLGKEELQELIEDYDYNEKRSTKR